MSLLRRRMMMQQKIEKIVFSDLSVSKCISNPYGFYDIDGGIRADFAEKRDVQIILNTIIEAGKEYEIEFDFSAERSLWNSKLILNVYVGSWYMYNVAGSDYVSYVDDEIHYKNYIEPYSEDRKVVLIANSHGTATGYAEFTNLIIREV